MRRPAALTAAVIVVGAVSLGTGCSVFSADEEALAPPPAASLTTDPGIGLTVVDEADRGARASQVCNMGRMAAHTGQRITWDQSINAPAFAPKIDQMTLNGPAPVKADKDGKYPVPMPGIIKDREY